MVAHKGDQVSISLPQFRYAQPGANYRLVMVNKRDLISLHIVRGRVLADSAVTTSLYLED